MQHWSCGENNSEARWLKERNAHDFIQFRAVIAGRGGDTSAVTCDLAVGDEARLRVMVWVVASEDETFVCTLWGELWDGTGRLGARRRGREALIAQLSLVVHLKQAAPPPRGCLPHNPSGTHHVT